MNDHKLVLLSLKRGQCVKGIMQVSTSRGWDDDINYCGDGDSAQEAIDFGALYTEDELRSLAESFGPDLEVQPATIYTTEIRHERILGDQRDDKSWVVDTSESVDPPSQSDCDMMAAEQLKTPDITGVEVVVYATWTDEPYQAGDRLDVGGFYLQQYLLVDSDNGSFRRIGAFNTLREAEEAARLATDDGWEEPDAGSRTPHVEGYRCVKVFREDETTRYVGVLHSNK